MSMYIPFSEHEAVLLLDAYLEMISLDVPRSQVVRKTSEDLRKMAKNNGQQIDDIFRNVNGISFQMASMESAYQGHTIMKPATKLFLRISELYKNDKEHYSKLLKEAKAMVENKITTAEQFAIWLSAQVPPAQLSELYFCYHDIEEFCSKIRVLKQPLFETTDLETVKSVQKTVAENKAFKLQHKKQMKKIILAAQLYTMFIKEINKKSAEEKLADNTPIQTELSFSAKSIEAQQESIASTTLIRNKTDRSLQEKYPLLFKKIFIALARHSEPMSVEGIQNEIGMHFRVTDIFTILMQASWSKECAGGYYQYAKESAFHEEPATLKLMVDFTKEVPMMFTKPTKVAYFGDDLGLVTSWTDAYVKAAAALYDDYPTIIPINRAFGNENGRPDFGDEIAAKKMVAPMRVAENCYLETNASVTEIVKKLKMLLDICNVDYENVEIEYECKSQSSIPKPINSIGNAAKSRAFLANDDAFYNYLKKVDYMAEATCRSYVSAIRGIERYAKEHDYQETRIFGQAPETIRDISDVLFQDEDFIEYNAQQHNRFRSAINKLLESMDSEKIKRSPPEQQLQMFGCGDTSDYEKVLEERFVKGFRLGSSLEMKKFKRFYEELNGKELTKEDSEIEMIIRSCSIIHEEKAFMPKTMLGDEIKVKLLQYIADSFANGKSSIYYEALFEEFSEEFLDHYVYNAEMLKAYLIHVNDGSYHIGKNQITKEAGTFSDPIAEVRACLKDQGGPMETDRLCDILSHLPKNNIVEMLSSNMEFVRNGRGEYFHADVMDFSEEELENIADIIDGAIHSRNFISGTELIKAIKAKYPYTYEPYSAYSDSAWRDALKYKLGNRFSFIGNIISDASSTLSMTDVFRDLVANVEQISMNELLNFADEMGTVIYFGVVYDYAIRVSEDLFVSKKQAKFQVKETDAILDRFVTGSYLPLKDVSVFGIFPDAGFTWNIYLLESYVASYSEKYALMFHRGFNRNCAVGAIVKRSSGYRDWDSFVVDVLADSNINLDKSSALDYLVKNGYIARRAYSGIEGLLIRANAKRQARRRS